MGEENGGANMLTEKDYCDYETSIALGELGFPLKRMKVKNFIEGQYSDSIVTVLLYEAQKWLREEKKIHIAPRIYLYHDINLDEQVSWECNIYAEWTSIFTKGKGLTYTDALLLGIKEAIKILTNNGTM